MGTYCLSGPSPFDDDPCIDEILAICDRDIRKLAIKSVPRNVFHKDVLDIADELAQNTLIKLWGALQRWTVHNPVSYARGILAREVVNMVRSYRYDLPLETNEDGELIYESLSQGLRGEMSNPETAVVEREAVEELLANIAEAIRELGIGTRQQQAAVSRLNERVDDVFQFKDAIKSRGVDADMAFPVDRKARQTLQSSYSPAKSKLADRLGVDLALYK